MQTWSLEKISLELAVPWTIAREHSPDKENFIVRIEDDQFKGEGEVAPSIRFAEDEQSINNQFDCFLRDLPITLQSLEELLDYLDELELKGALRFGIESAFVHYLSNLSEKSVPELLGLNAVSSCQTMLSLPIVDSDGMKRFFSHFNTDSFSTLKVKCNADFSPTYLDDVMKFYAGSFILDFNESFSDPEQVIALGKKLVSYNIRFMEQPLPAEMYDEYLYLKEKRLIPIFADESLQEQQVSEFYSERFDGVNVKLMKTGSYVRAIKQLRDAKSFGLSTMLGCRIETSLGISSALGLSSLAQFIDLDGCLFLKQDPFNLIFQQSGRLTISQLH
jgi:glutamate racemase